MVTTADQVPRCPHCDSTRTTATPAAGPDAPFHCPDCDRSFTTGDL